MNSSYRIVPHTADIAIEARGPDLGAALTNAARALFSVMVDLRTVRLKEWTEVEMRSDSAEALLVEWLGELLYLSQTKHLLLRSFRPVALRTGPDDWYVRMRCGGEPFDDSRHEPKNDVKAVTYHAATVQCGIEGCLVRAVLDV